MDAAPKAKEVHVALASRLKPLWAISRDMSLVKMDEFE